MITSTPKKRAPFAQLRKAAKTAFDMLSERHVVHSLNVLEELAKDAKAPILPGMPSYLPHRWTIHAAQTSMMILLKDWVKKTNHNLRLQDSASDFFKYVVLRMQEEERKFSKQVRDTDTLIKKGMKKAPLLSDIFSPLQRKQTAKSMHKFFVDSFAISVIVHSNGSTGDYADWFLNEWTPELYKLWEKKQYESNK
jgi:hypothetical protein